MLRSFLFPKNILLYGWGTFFLYTSPTDGHVGYFYVLAIATNTAMITCVRVLCVREVFPDENQAGQASDHPGDGVLSVHQEGVRGQFRGLDASLVIFQGAGAACPPVSRLVSSLRVRVRRKQAARKREGMDDEDPVMGTVAWVSDVVSQGPRGWVRSLSPD